MKTQAGGVITRRRLLQQTPNLEAVWHTLNIMKIHPFYERTSKRRRGFPSEAQVKKGQRVVHGNKELAEKLGRRDLCPCGSGRRFQELLPGFRPI